MMGCVFSLVILVTRVCMSLQLLLPGLLGTSHHRAKEAQSVGDGGQNINVSFSR